MNAEASHSPESVPQATKHSTVGTPWHLWVIGIVTALWNAMGVLDFIMTVTKNEAYMSGFTQEQLDYFYGFPMWVVVIWAIAVFGSLLGSLMLLLRTKLAVAVFAISLLAMVSTAIYNFVFTNGLEIMGTGGAIFTAIIFVVAALLVFYAVKMKQAGVLR